jgi:hypothetical protein
MQHYTVVIMLCYVLALSLNASTLRREVTDFCKYHSRLTEIVITSYRYRSGLTGNVIASIVIAEAMIKVITWNAVIVLDMRAGCCLGPEGNGVSLGEGGEGRPGPQEARKISSQCSVRAETTWTRTRKDGQVGCDEEGSE